MNFELIFFAGIVLLILGGFAVQLCLESARRKKMEQLSRHLNMSYTPKPDSAVVDRHPHFELFNIGRARKTTNLMERTLDGLSVACFDYQYTVGYGKNSRTDKQSVVSILNPALALPHFVMKPETFFHKIKKAFSGDDINFDTHPQFSKMFLLTGENEKEIRALFTDKVLRFFEEAKGLHIEADGSRIIFFKKRHRCAVDQIEPFIKDSLETLGMLAASSAGK